MKGTIYEDTKQQIVLNDKEKAFRCKMCGERVYCKDFKDLLSKEMSYCDSNTHKRARGIDESRINVLDSAV